MPGDILDADGQGSIGGETIDGPIWSDDNTYPLASSTTEASVIDGFASLAFSGAAHLVVNVRTVDVAAEQLTELQVNTRVPFSGFSFGAFGIFRQTSRSVTMRTIDVAAEKIVEVTATRVWAGIGGVQYVPSFPQLDRQNTTWPHAS